MIFFTYLLTVDASVLNGQSELHRNDSIPGQERNATGVVDGFSLANGASWARIVNEWSGFNSFEVPVQIFTSQCTLSTTQASDDLLDPDARWAIGELAEAQIDASHSMLMPVVPQPSATACSLMLVSRVMQEVVILVGNEQPIMHLAPSDLHLAELQKLFKSFECLFAKVISVVTFRLVTVLVMVNGFGLTDAGRPPRTE